MRRTSLFLLLAAAAIGCGEAAPAARSITGRARVRSSDGKLESIDIGHTFLEASFADGAGNWTVRRGLSTEDGTFTVTGVPAGGYWLRIHSNGVAMDNYLWTDADALDFDQDIPGRSGISWSSLGTRLRLDHMGGLAPWTDQDGIMFVSGSLGFAGVLSIGPDEGKTELNGTVPWSGWPLPTAADDGMIIQLHRDDGVVPYVSPVRVASLAGFSLPDGSTGHVATAFTEPPPKPYHLVWKRSLFASFASTIHPTRALRPDEQPFEFAAMPGGAAHGILLPVLPPVVGVERDAILGNDDKDWTFTLHHPYPDDWLVTMVAASYPVPIPVPGDASQAPAVAFASISMETNVVPSPEHPLQPILSPVRNPRIDGKDLFADQSGVGLTPELSWDPPQIGSPTGYIIDVFRWQGIESGIGSLDGVAELAVPGDVTRVHLPPGVLDEGMAYVTSIRAVSQAGQDVRHHATFQTALPHAVADVFGNTFKP